MLRLHASSTGPEAGESHESGLCPHPTEELEASKRESSYTCTNVQWQVNGELALSRPMTQSTFEFGEADQTNAEQPYYQRSPRAMLAHEPAISALVASSPEWLGVHQQRRSANPQAALNLDHVLLILHIPPTVEFPTLRYTLIVPGVAWGFRLRGSCSVALKKYYVPHIPPHQEPL